MAFWTPRTHSKSYPHVQTLKWHSTWRNIWIGSDTFDKIWSYEIHIGMCCPTTNRSGKQRHHTCLNMFQLLWSRAQGVTEERGAERMLIGGAATALYSWHFISNYIRVIIFPLISFQKCWSHLWHALLSSRKFSPRTLISPYRTSVLMNITQPEELLDPRLLRAS